MADIGIFSGLWQGISSGIGSTFGAATHVIDENTGAADKQRQFAIDQQTLVVQQAKQKQNFQITIVVVSAAVVLIITALIIKSQQNGVVQ